MAFAREIGLMASARKNVLVLGGREVDRQMFEIRGLTLQRTRTSDLKQDDLDNACGILVAEPAGQLREIVALRARAEELFSMGLMVGIWFADAKAGQQAREFSQTFAAAFQAHPRAPAGGSRWIEIKQELELLAEALRAHNPGPSSGNPAINLYDPTTQLPAEHSTLLRRAFSDASVLIVEALAGGKTAAGTYRIFVQLKTGGPQPMPFVFKVAKTTKSEGRDEWCNPLYREIHNYQSWAEPFIPFHLRPGLLEKRCVITPLWTAISCTFVGGAVALETTLQHRQGAGRIFSLFESTLRGLRAHTLQSEPASAVVRTFIRERVKAERFEEDGVLKKRLTIAKKVGFASDPRQLQDDLEKASAGITSRRGIYHGDLHLANIMVRDHDAIVIDFGSMDEFGPITADPATLEASIVFGTKPPNSEELQCEWTLYVDRLYEAPLNPPPPSAEHFQYGWMNHAVRELRHVVHCCEAKPLEILIVLAASLLRFARLASPDYKDPLVNRIAEERRAYALVVAQRVYSEALNRNGQSTPH